MVHTLVIGVGMAGIKVVQSLSDLIEEHDKKYPDEKDLHNYQFIAIDSSSVDLNNIINSNSPIHAITLTEQGIDVQDMIDNCEYLYDQAAPHQTEALRERVYGRFLLDLNRETVFNGIQSALEKFSVQNAKYIHIWLIHSLGGGTGSGTFISLISGIKQKAENMFGEGSGTTCKIFGIGIVPSVSDLSDLNHLNHANPKYFANAYAALKELECLEEPNNVAVKVFNRSGKGQTEIIVNKRPFDKYLLFGVNEERVHRIDSLSEEQSDERREIMEYLKAKNLIISNMIYAINPIANPGGIGNFWNDGIPYGTFGESELIIPFKPINSIAYANDMLGLKENSSVIQNQLDILFQSTDNLDKNNLERRCKNILNEAGLRNLELFIRELERKACDESNKATMLCIDRTKDILDELDDLHKWVRDPRYDNDFNVIISSGFDANKPDDLIKLLQQRIEDNQDESKSLRNFFKRKPYTNERLDLENYLNEISDLKEIARIHSEFFSYITSTLCENNEEVKKLLQAYSHKEITKNDGGAGFLLQTIGAIRQKIRNVKDKQLSDLSINHSRVMSLGIPEKHKDLLDQLYHIKKPDGVFGFDHRDINSQKIMNATDYIDIFKIETSILKDIWEDRIAFAKKHDVDPLITTQKRGWRERTDLYILRNKMNDGALARIKYLNPATQTIDMCDEYRFIILTFNFGFLLNETGLYRNRDKEYNEDRLHEIIGTLNENTIGEIFAYPEFFPDDENVKKVFTKMYPQKN